MGPVQFFLGEDGGGRIMAHVPVRHPCGAIAIAMLRSAPGAAARTGTAVLVQPLNQLKKGPAQKLAPFLIGAGSLEKGE